MAFQTSRGRSLPGLAWRRAADGVQQERVKNVMHPQLALQVQAKSNRVDNLDDIKGTCALPVQFLRRAQSPEVLG